MIIMLNISVNTNTQHDCTSLTFESGQITSARYPPPEIKHWAVDISSLFHKDVNYPIEKSTLDLILPPRELSEIPTNLNPLTTSPF